MITRIVKMTIESSETHRFEKLFKGSVEHIRVYEGCIDVQLMKDVNKGNVYFTLSKWSNETALDNYRASAFFKLTWSKVKPLFAEKAEAWSLRNT
ncbi:MAG: antibiotic biosynthesis monooxygenase [Daejeonella sp.]